VIFARPAILAFVGSLVLLPLPAGAGAPTEQVRVAVEKAIQVLEDPALQPDGKAPERQAAVRAAIVDLLDFTEIGRRALARHWRPLTDSDRQEFVALFRTLLERTYLPKIKLYKGQRLQFLSEAVDGNFASVQARAQTSRGQEVSVTFRLHQRGERWLVFDTTVEGISLVSNYRAQFDQIVQRESYQGLVARLKQRLESGDSLDAGDSSPPAKRK
jgi:phospholipid transport system substrate-binding protein